MKVKCPKCGSPNLTVIYKETTEYTFTLEKFRGKKIVAFDDALETYDSVFSHAQCNECDKVWESEEGLINELSKV